MRLLFETHEISQRMHCSEGRVLELSVTIHVAPGNLTGYTKVVRISPSYVVVNRLYRPIRIWQDSSLLHPALENQSNQEINIRKNQQRWYFEQERQHPLDAKNPYEVLFGGPAGLQSSPPGTTAHKLALFAVAARAGELSPFHLPDTRGDRQFRIDIGGEWNLSPSFNSDVTGEYNFRIRKAINLRDLKHVNTRASPYYQVILPPADGSDWDGELGVWFETVWGGGRKILVKGTKRTRFAFKNTDIRVGDELLQVDNVSVMKLTFSETMKLLRERIEQVSNSSKYDNASRHRTAPQLRSWKKRRSSRFESFDCRSNDDGKEAPDSVVITFRTLEERLRRVRVNASKSNQGKAKGYSAADSCKTISHAEVPNAEDPDLIQSVNMQVEVREIYGSLFVLISEQDSLNPPYQIENRAINHFVLYRQRGCVCHPWNILYPGESSDYFWEEPVKAHKLIVRVGSIFFPFQRKGKNSETNSIHNNEIPENQKRKNELNRWLHNQSFHAIEGEDQAGFGAATIVKLEEIGFECKLPLPRVSSQQNSLDNSLHCQVDSNGATRVLLISNNLDNQDDSLLMEHNITTLQKGICMAENLVRSYDDMLQPLSKIAGKIDDATTPMSEGVIEKLSGLENKAMELADFPETHTIFQRHQILIQVLEAAGLTIPDVTSQCNPYCEIISKGPKKSKSLFANTTISTRKTYFIEGTLSPKWIDQIFVFDLPKYAIENTREYTIKVRLRSFRFVGQHPYLGETNVHLRSLRDQKELIGWYPLVGRTGRRDLDDTNANWGRGSIKLRVQWIFTVPALIQYFRTIAEENVRKLQESLDGMTSQISRERSFEPESDRLNHPDFMKETRIEKHSIATRLFAQRNQRNRSERILPWQLFESMKSSREKILWLFDFQTKSSREARTNLTGLSKGISQCFAPMATKNDIPDLNDIKKNEWNDSKSSKRDLNEIKFLLPSDDDAKLALHHSQHVISPTDIDLIQSKDRISRKRSFSLEEILRTIDELDRSHVATFSRGSGDSDLDCRELGILEQKNFIDINKVTSLHDITGRRLIYQLKRSKFIREHLSYHVRLAFLEEGFDAIILPKARHRLSSADTCFKTMSITRLVMNDPYVEFDCNNNKFEWSCVSRRTVEGPVANSLSQEEMWKNNVIKEIGLPSNAPGAMITRLEERINSIFIARSAFEKSCKNSMESLLHPGGFLVIRPITALNLPSSYTAISIKVRFGSLTLYTSAVDSRVAPSWVQAFAHDIHHSCAEVIGTSSMPENMNENSKQNSQLENDLCIPIDPQKTSGIIRLSVIGERLNSKVELGILEVPIGLAIRCCIESADGKDAASTGLAYCRWFPLMNPKEDNTQMFCGLQALRSEQEVETWFTQNFLPCIQLVLMWNPREGNNGPSNTEQRQGHLQENRQLPLMRNFKFYFNTLLSRVSVSLINSQIGEELISLSFCEIEARCLISMMSTRVTIVIGWIQMDNQLENARERVVLAPTPVGQPEPTLQFLLNRDNIRSKDNVESFELVAFYMEELDFTIEESLVLNLWEFIVWMLRKRELKRHALNYQRKKASNDRNETSQALLVSSNEVSSHRTLLQLLWDDNDKPEAKTYIERMCLGPIRVNLTYLKGKRMIAPDMDNPSFLKGSLDGIQDVLSAFHSGPQGFARNSDIFSKWTDYTHDEDLLTEMAEGEWK
jgi:C2 domain/SHR-binding domain of vacuolar-sorting associated protein 13